MKKIILGISLFSLFVNSAMANVSQGILDVLNNPIIKNDTIIMSDTFETYVVVDSVMVNKMYDCLKKSIEDKNMSDWTDSSSLYLSFLKKSNEEYNITLNVTFLNIALNLDNDIICKYRKKTFYLQGDIPPYFKNSGKIAISGEVIRPFTVTCRYYFFKYKDGEFYHCNGKFEILPD